MKSISCLSIEGLKPYSNNDILNPTGFQEETKDFFVHLDRYLTKTDKKIFNVYIKFFNRYKCVYPEQKTIARYANCCLKTVARSLAKLTKFGLIEIDPRLFTSHVYRINKMFNDIFMRRLFSKLFPALKFIPFLLLTENVHQYKKNINLVQFNSVQKDRLTYKGESEFTMNLPKEIKNFNFTSEELQKLEPYSEVMEEGLRILRWKLKKSSLDNKFGYLIRTCTDLKKKKTERTLSIEEQISVLSGSHHHKEEKSRQSIASFDEKGEQRGAPSKFANDYNYLQWLTSPDGYSYIHKWGCDEHGGIRPDFQATAKAVRTHYLALKQAEKDKEIEKNYGMASGPIRTIPPLPTRKI